MKSKVVTPRNPFATDPGINYELDTEEEYEELVSHKKHSSMEKRLRVRMKRKIRKMDL